MAKEKKIVKKATAMSSLPEALQATILSLQKDNKESIYVLGDVDGLSWHGKTIPTGCITLDRAIGIIKKDGDNYSFGLPGGRVVEIFGPESSGKTTLCNGIIASSQSQGGICAFIDMEHSWDGGYAEQIGVNLDRLIFAQPPNGEDALNMVESLIRTGELDVIVVDSVAALVPKAEVEGETGASFMGLHARMMSQFLRKNVGLLNKSNTTIIFTNQMRNKIGVMFGNPETTTGGDALKFYASIRMDIRVIAKLKDAAGEFIGNRCCVKVIKNKIAPPFKKAEFDIIYGVGVDRYGAVLDAAAEVGVIEKKGSWYNYCGNQLAQGRAASVALLKGNETLFKGITQEVIQKIYEDKNGNIEEADEVITDGEAERIEPAPTGV